MFEKYQWVVNHLFVLCMCFVAMAYIFSGGFNLVSLIASFVGIALQFLNLGFIFLDSLGD